MERRHAEMLRQRFGEVLTGKHIAVLDIPDEYRRDDPDLVLELRAAVERELRELDLIG